MDAVAAAGLAYLIGAIPISFLVARFTSGVDLRTHGSRSVSGSNVGASSGFVPMAVAGLLDIGKGAVAVAPVADRPGLAALASGCAVVGHNWSLYLRFAGGRGVGPAIGSTLVLAWPGTVVIGVGLAAGRLAAHTATGTFLAQAALPVVLGVAGGADGAWLGIALVLPMWVKRIVGNAPPRGGYRPAAAAFRLIRDHDREDATGPRRADEAPAKPGEAE